MEPCALGFAELPDLRDERFAVLMGVHGVLVRQFAEFVGGEMVSFPVGGGGSGVGVGRQVVQFCGSIVRALWHRVPPGLNPNYDSALTAKLLPIAQFRRKVQIHP